MVNENEELCLETNEYIEWFDRVVNPRMRKFAAHLVHCPKCQSAVLIARDSVGLQMITQTDEQSIQNIQALADQAEDSA